MFRLCFWEERTRFGWAKGRRAIHRLFLPPQLKTDPGNGETYTERGLGDGSLLCFHIVEYETILIQPPSPISSHRRSSYIPSKNNVSSCQTWLERGGEDKT